MRPILRPVLISVSILFFLSALYCFRVMLARADSPEETLSRNDSICIGLFLFTSSVVLGVCAVFMELPHDPSKKFESKRIGCLAVAVLIIGFVAAVTIMRMLKTDH